MHLPVTISVLSRLETLSLEPCDELLELSEHLPRSLANLSVVSKKLKSIPYYSVSRSVIHLKLISGCESSSFDLNWVEKLHRLKTLELCFPRITDLDFAAMTELSSLSLSSRYLECFSQLQSSLSRLSLAHLNVETVIQNLSRLEKLTFLELRGLSVNGEVGFAELESVEHLSVHKCKFNSLPKKLRAVYISECEFPEGVLDLTELNDLVHLQIMDCRERFHVRGVAGLKSLEEINICDCNSLETVDSLLDLNRLEALKLNGCRELREVEGLDRVKDSLKLFQIFRCDSLRIAMEV